MKKRTYFLVITLLVMMLAFQGCQFLPSQETTSSPVAFQVTYLDVGQADATVIQAGGNTMLIDAGGNSTADGLVSTLKKMGISRFDIIIGTHPHEDHIGGMDVVINQFDINKVYLPKASATTRTFTDVLESIKKKGLTVTTPVPGSSFNLGPVSCTILAPNSQSYDDTNNYSIVLRVFYGDTSFLFTGDAEALSEKEILARSYTLKSDVLKVGHHGSNSSTSDNFLKAVAPRYAVVSVGSNDYGHPHQVTLDKLAGAGVQIFRTDQNGAIIFTSDGSNLKVKTGR